MEKPFTLEFEEDLKYKLSFKGKLIGDGRLPPDIISEMVRLMNMGYSEGLIDGENK